LTNDKGTGLKLTNIDGTSVGTGGTTITTAKGGSLTIDEDGNYIYTPSTGFVGKDTIIYTVCDDQTPQNCKDEYLIITVLPTIDPN
jgi:VCBS repeat-containing protein